MLVKHNDMYKTFNNFRLDLGMPIYEQNKLLDHSKNVIKNVEDTITKWSLLSFHSLKCYNFDAPYLAYFVCFPLKMLIKVYVCSLLELPTIVSHSIPHFAYRNQSHKYA